MSWTIELYDPASTNTYDITARTNRITVSEKLRSESNSFRLNCFAIDLLHRWNVVTIKWSGTTKYKGFVINQIDTDDNGMKVTEFECYDYSFLFNVRVAAKEYTSQTIDAVFKDLLSEHVSEVTTTNVDSSAFTVDTLRFDYISVMDAIGKTFEHAYNYYWYVDETLDAHMFYQFETTGATITESGVLSGSLKVEYEGDQTANRIWIVGAKQVGSTFLYEYFTGDGNNRRFLMPYEPNYTDIYLDTGGGYVLKTSALEQNDNGGYDFLINKKQKLIMIPDNVGTPWTGAIKVKYKPTIQLIDYYENPGEAATYGLIEKVVRNKDITDKLTSVKFGRSEIKRKSATKRKVSFATRTERQIGTKHTVDITTVVQKGTWSISGDFVVTNVTMNTNMTDIVYTVELEELIL